jgi:integrase
MAHNIFKRPGRKGWYVRVIRNGRRIIRGSFSTISAAQLALARLRRDLERGELGLPKRSGMSLREFTEQRYLPWAEQHKRSWATDASLLRARVLPKFGGHTLSDVTRERVERYLKDRLAEVKPASANREAALFRRMLNLAVEWNLLDENPLARLRLFPESPPRLPTLDLADEARLLDACPTWMRPVVRLAVTSACRLGELLALKWRHADFDAGTLAVENPEKKGNPRVVPLHPALLDDLRRRRGLPEGFVLLGEDGEHPPHENSVTHAFKRTARRIGRPDLRFHDLRHVAATRLLASGASLPEVMAVTGHKTVPMGLRYAHATRSRLQDLIARMPVATCGEATPEQA